MAGYGWIWLDMAGYGWIWLDGHPDFSKVTVRDTGGVTEVDSTSGTCKAGTF